MTLTGEEFTRVWFLAVTWAAQTGDDGRLPESLGAAAAAYWSLREMLDYPEGLRIPLDKSGGAVTIRRIVARDGTESFEADIPVEFQLRHTEAVARMTRRR